MKPEVKTNLYEVAWRHKPTGKGTWVFADHTGLQSFWFQGWYSDAKKAAIKAMGDAGHRIIYVCS